MQKKIQAFTCALLVCSLLTPSFAKAESYYLPYDDISKHWARNSILNGAYYGLFATGQSVPHFYPNREMTRAEFMALMDRVFELGQIHLYPLTFLSEREAYGRGEGFDEPYLPYKDVDRLTWMYGSTLRMSVLLQRLYGPGAIQKIFPGEEFQPNKPITREEAAKLLAIYTMGADESKAWEMVSGWGWLDGRPNNKLKRGEAAVAFDRLIDFMQSDTILPLLDYDGQKFPMVPEIEDMFPLFSPYLEQSQGDDKLYVDAVEAIRYHEDSDETFRTLHKLAEGGFDNTVGVHYYLSWNPSASLEENLSEAFLAMDAYFADRIVIPETQQLLTANVYDIALQIGMETPAIFEQVLTKLKAYEEKVRPGTKEWEALVVYQAALEVKLGNVEGALEHYRAIAAHVPAALTNLVYYLVQTNRVEEAKSFLASLQPKRTETEIIKLSRLLEQDLARFDNQESIVHSLQFAMGRMENLKDYRVEGEAVLSGFLMKYTQDIDRIGQWSHTTGIYQSPQKLVLDKWENYTDLKNMVQYERNFDEEKWEPSKIGELEFMHEYVQNMSIKDRASILGARYYKQSFGEYNIITEWIPGENILEESKKVTLRHGKVKRVPIYMNKYIVDKDSDLVVQSMWRYEEVYDTQEYVAYAGTESYLTNKDFRVYVPREALKEAAR
ncbi:S-layer homology domain-containing protein [Brevibacillus ruminantium]|uniref:S-layer homology domain-containing protein n=1 Tax=Brevibacillus ruminantium TaxID=2950604 RepID=A0ABY4WAG4_9BACL|nr:S-layer homology domain-containing protein [Brevibacillus ruminantium]USG63841.1 S-layer homology domain-containing protein [Brevibacillus ruminantium]